MLIRHKIFHGLYNLYIYLSLYLKKKKKKNDSTTTHRNNYVKLFDFLSFTLFSVKSLNRYELLLVNQ